VLEPRNLHSAYINMRIPVILRPNSSVYDLQKLRYGQACVLKGRGKINVRSGDSKRQHPSFVPQGQISQKALRNVMPLILHTQPMGCYWSNNTPTHTPTHTHQLL